MLGGIDPTGCEHRTDWSEFDEPTDSEGARAVLVSAASRRSRIMMPVRRAGRHWSVPVCVLDRGNIFARRLLCFDKRPRNRREPLTKKVEA
jgi:hypothetical protein